MQNRRTNAMIEFNTQSCNIISVFITSPVTWTYSTTHISHPLGPIDKGIYLDRAANVAASLTSIVSIILAADTLIYCRNTITRL